MNIELIKLYLGKKCLIVLKNNFRHFGTIEKLYNDSLSFNDIVSNEFVAISYDEISIIREKERTEKRGSD